MKSFFIKISVLVCVAGWNCAAQAQNEWTGWLGPNRDGWVDGFVAPNPWPEQLTKVWEAEVGTGYGSPLVVGDRVFQHARHEDQEVVWCLDLKDGAMIWESRFDRPFRTAPGGEFHENGPKACPVYADGRLFTMSIDGLLTAWDAENGNALWRKNYDSRFGKSHPNWGNSMSPIVDGRLVFAHFGTDDQGVLVALDTASGEEVWSHGKDGASYSSPLITELGGIRQVVEWNHEALIGVDIKSGDQLWRWPFPHIGKDQNMPTPAIHNDRILIGGENRGVYSVHPQLRDGKWSVADEWHQQRVALDMSSAVINDGMLYGFSHYDRGRLFCLDPKNGEIKWTSPPRTGENVMFLSFAGHVAALIDNGELRILRASADSYEVAASYRVANRRTWAPPVLFGDKVLIKGHQELTLWTFQ
ncbi:MAG: PQQ-binding-like beta-propeller repeat protein [Verrucomicrobiota bacterium]